MFYLRRICGELGDLAAEVSAVLAILAIGYPFLLGELVTEYSTWGQSLQKVLIVLFFFSKTVGSLASPKLCCQGGKPAQVGPRSPI